MRNIVSLTSYGQRVAKLLPQTLKAIYEMADFSADVVLLYLTESDYELLDKNLLIEYPTLSVRIVDRDIKSYKKYLVLADREFDDDVVMLADDDVMYNRGTWKELFKLYTTRKPDEQQYVYSGGAWIFDGIRIIPPTHTRTITTDNFMFWSGYGLLVPPQTMRIDEDLLNLGFDYCNHDGHDYINDDAFLSVYCQKENIKCVCRYENQTFLDFENNLKLRVAYKNKLATHLLLSKRCLNVPVEHIVVSLTISNPRKAYEKVVTLLTGQSLAVDRVVLFLDNSQSDAVSKRLTGLQDQYPFEIVFSDNVPYQRWQPDNTDENDLIYAINGDLEIDDNLTERFYSSYYFLRNDSAITVGKETASFERYGDRRVISEDLTVVRVKYLNNINQTERGVVMDVSESVLSNHRSIQPCL